MECLVKHDIISLRKSYIPCTMLFSHRTWFMDVRCGVRALIHSQIRLPDYRTGQCALFLFLIFMQMLSQYTQPIIFSGLRILFPYKIAYLFMTISTTICQLASKVIFSLSKSFMAKEQGVSNLVVCLFLTFLPKNMVFLLSRESVSTVGTVSPEFLTAH